MTVILNQTMPAGTPIQLLDEVTDEMGVKSDPPAGLIVHVHYEHDGQVHVVDVWDSQEQYETFRDQRLMPAMQKVAGNHGMDLSQSQPNEPTVIPVHGMVRAR